MASVIQRVKEHFRALPPLRMEIPEWGEDGKPLVVTWTPRTMADGRKISRANDDGSPVQGQTMLVRAIVLKACDEKGELLFNDLDDENILLTQADGDVVGRLGTAIVYGGNKAVPPDERVDAAKNA